MIDTPSFLFCEIWFLRRIFRFRLSIGACSLGASQKCFEKSLAYSKVWYMILYFQIYGLINCTILYFSKERKQFGKPISANQVTQVFGHSESLFYLNLFCVQFKFAEMAKKIVLSRLALRSVYNIYASFACIYS
jgi:hypothetical protein